MGWKAAIVSEPAASRGSSTGRTKAGQMAAGTAHARWGSAQRTRPKKNNKCFSSCLERSGFKAFVLLPFSWWWGVGGFAWAYTGAGVWGLAHCWQLLVSLFVA